MQSDGERSPVMHNPGHKSGNLNKTTNQGDGMDIDRYSEIRLWALRRYEESPGIVVVWTKGAPTRYKIICDLAFDKYVLNK